jgi:mannose/cellobiose epimerase-like protein (N-acyl-D-glucosamine 2-epimerase family)
MGDPIEKAQELFLTMVVGDKDAIAAETKLFKKNIETLVLFSTDIALDWEAKFSGIKRTRNITAAQKKKLPEILEEWDEKFHDEVFGYESNIRKGVWIHEVSEKQKFLLDPEEIRKKLGY